MGILNRQVVVVIGGSSGIGLGCALKAADAGAHVEIVSRSESKLADAVPLLGENAKYSVLDIRDEQAVANYFEQCDPFNHLIITASPGAVGPVKQMNSDKAHNFFETKFWGTFFCAKYAGAKIADDGSIVLVSGIASRRPVIGMTVAGACNGALESFARGLALELAPVRVNTIAPGLVDTPLYEKIPQAQREVFLESTAQRLPAGKIGRPTDIGEAALMLMTNSYITGTTVDVDGGHLVTS